DVEVLAGDIGDGIDQLGHRDVLGAADVGGPCELGLHQLVDAIDHVVHVGVGAHRAAVSPHLDRAAVVDLGHLPADCRWGLLPAALPRALGPVAILEAGNPYLHARMPAVRHRHTLGIELL